MFRSAVFSWLVVLLLLTTSAFAGQVFVFNTNDARFGSLRQALIDAQTLACPMPCDVVFKISEPLPPEGYWTITPLSPLPPINVPLINIDGTTQTAYTGDTNPNGPEVVLSGLAGPTVGLFFRSAGGSTIRGLGFEHWGAYALSLNGQVPIPPSAPPIRNVRVIDNYFGVEANGHKPAPNGSPIFFIWAEDCSVEGNVISANEEGVTVWASSRITIRNNVIGMDATLKRTLGNGQFGVRLFGSRQSMITNNIIAGHTFAAVTMENAFSNGNEVRRNSMDRNGYGIDLGNDGPTANDVADLDSGANDLQNHPTLRNILGTLFGDLDSTPNSGFDIDIYETDSRRAAQGTRYLTTISVKTSAAGLASFSLVLPRHAGKYITATATDLTTRNTSEFCDPVR